MVTRKWILQRWTVCHVPGMGFLHTTYLEPCTFCFIFVVINRLDFSLGRPRVQQVFEKKRGVSSGVRSWYSIWIVILKRLQKWELNPSRNVGYYLYIRSHHRGSYSRSARSLAGKKSVLFRLAFWMFCGSWDRKPLLAVTALYFSVYLIHCSFMTTTWCYNTVQ